MTCQECELALGLEESTPEVAWHVAGCPGCKGITEELRLNAAALRGLVSDPLPGLSPKRRMGWEWAIPVAAMLVLGFVLSREWSAPQPEVAKTPAEAGPVIVPEPVEAAIPAHRPVMRRARTAPSESLMVKMQTSDPDVVIYWIVESKEGTE